MTKTKFFNVTIFVFTIIAGMIIGIMFINNTPKVSAVSPSIPKYYQVNSNGQTYGSALTADFVGKEPDLVAVVCADGTKGYAYAKDLKGPDFKSPEEALAYEKNNPSVTVPVYEADGKTVVGQFVLAYGGGITLTTEEKANGITMAEKIEQVSK
ncbi:hypothetical protein [Sporobacter termitidis]|uniref:hypothetical protein n=1 Tax=Sporobacter termitidis TaxID=44749 RepID=UPI00093388A0|nr:hypothetical protein [Sporobacter termitidis]